MSMISRLVGYAHSDDVDQKTRNDCYVPADIRKHVVRKRLKRDAESHIDLGGRGGEDVSSDCCRVAG